MVSIQAMTILLAIFHFTEDAFFIVPIPNIEPVMVCVVLTGTQVRKKHKV